MQTLAYSNITVLIEVIHLYHTFMNLMGGGLFASHNVYKILSFMEKNCDYVC